MKNSFKKLVSVFMVVALIASVFTFGASAATRKLDLAFVIDTTGSMSDDIAEVKENMKEYLDDLDASGMDYRIAIVDYRDFAERSVSIDYPYKVQLDFTDNYDDILAGINGLNLGHGGDYEETICSALIDGLDEVSWRNDAGKAAILMGDAPALDPEPYTGYTKEQAVNKLLHDNTAYEEKVDELSVALAGLSFSEQAATRSKVTLFTIATSLNSEVTEDFEYLAEQTGGEQYTADDVADITDIITEIIDIIPDVVEDVDASNAPETFFEKLIAFFKNIWYFITFQWENIIRFPIF